MYAECDFQHLHIQTHYLMLFVRKSHLWSGSKAEKSGIVKPGWVSLGRKKILPIADSLRAKSLPKAHLSPRLSRWCLILMSSFFYWVAFFIRLDPFQPSSSHWLATGETRWSRWWLSLWSFVGALVDHFSLSIPLSVNPGLCVSRFSAWIPFP